MRVETDKQEKITMIRVTKNLTPPALTINCFGTVPSTYKWKTSKGLRLGNECKRSVFLYGEPSFSSPGTKHGQPLELLYYPFDWAGPDVPQAMEVVCTAPKDGGTGRVVEITLAASRL